MDQNSFWNNLPDALTSFENAELMKEYKQTGSDEIKRKLIEGNLKFIKYYISNKMQWLVNCQSSVSPSLEDLLQQGVFVLIKAIDKFDVNYGTQFLTYLSNSLRNDLAMLKRNKNAKLAQKTQSLETPFQEKDGEEGGTLMDLLGDDNLAVEQINQRIEIEDLKRILKILPKKKRDIFLAYYIKGRTQVEIAEEYGISQSYLARQLESLSKQIKNQYEFGVTEADELARGVDLNAQQKERARKIHGFIKTYGRGFLEDYFCLRLTPRQRNIFKEYYLNYYGQSASSIGKKLDMSVSDVATGVSKIKSFIDKNVERLFEKYNEGQDAKSKKLTSKIRQRIKSNKMLVNEFGGEIFLRKYFLPTLTELEKRCFDAQVLSYYGDTQSNSAKKIGIEITNLYSTTERVIEKLKSTDFEVVVDLIDNAESCQIEPGVFSVKNIEKVKQRLSVVKKYGGVEFLRKYFLPTLPQQQRTVFEDLYLRPRFATYDSMSEHMKISKVFIIRCEKLILDKLEKTDFKALQAIDKMIEETLQQQSLNFGGDSFENEEEKKKSSERESGKQNLKVYSQEQIKKWGGKRIIARDFRPKLKTVKEQLMILYAIVQELDECEVFKNMGLKRSEFNLLRKNLSEKLDKFSEKQKEKTSKLKIKQ